MERGTGYTSYDRSPNDRYVQSRPGNGGSTQRGNRQLGSDPHQRRYNDLIPVNTSGGITAYVKNNSNSNSNDARKSKQERGESNSGSRDKKKKPTLGGILRRFGERSSMHGPPYVISSSWWLPRVLWTLLLMAALGCLSFHLYYLFRTYFAWPTKIKLSLGFSSLQFPAVTVCNVNPVRASMHHLLSPDLIELIDRIHPQKLGEVVEVHLASLSMSKETSVEQTKSDSSISFIDQTSVQQTKSDSSVIFINQTGMEQNGSDSSVSFIDQTSLEQNGSDSNNFTSAPNIIEVEPHYYDYDYYDHVLLDDIDFFHHHNFTFVEEVDDDDHLDDDEFVESWEKEGKMSQYARIEDHMHRLYAAQDRDIRRKAGHQLKDMLLSCSFAGKTCNAKNFSLVTSSTFGNCYTLEYEKFFSRASGPRGGLELILFLDTEEYLRGVTADDGLQIIVHPQQTMPFASDEGIAIAAGTHTMLSLKLIEIERKGKPYGDCHDHADYLKKYKVKYTRQTCYRFCEQKTLHEQCGCRDETKMDLNLILNATDIRPCQNKTEMRCLRQIQWRHQAGSLPCDCYNPCRESKFAKMVSSRPWPNKDYVNDTLLKTVCKRMKSDEKCDKLRSKDEYSVLREFVKLNIYYEDLNYENITEEADYEDVQFISDIGGTLGLWIGLSVLSIMEVAQLVLEVFKYLCCCRWARNKN